MANANIARGLTPVRHINGAPYSGSGRMYYVPASDGTALYIGDPVITVTGSADAAGIPTVTRAAAGGGTYITGVVTGVISGGDPVITRTRDTNVYREASTAAYVLVEDDPDILFEIQEDSVGGNMGAGAGGQNVDLIAGSGSAISGYSGWMADSSTLGTSNTKQLRVFEPVQRPDNNITDTGGYGKWLVGINLHSRRNLTGI